ncbi:MAG: hypothetical protein GWN55_05215 [Phycisphaerae bacterium]|nr:hypothetical protein [Phycisphaerae bacterium]
MPVAKAVLRNGNGSDLDPTFPVAIPDGPSNTNVATRHTRVAPRKNKPNQTTLTKVTPAADHMENQSESDGLLQRDQRTQMTLKVPAIRIDRNKALPKAHECFPKALFPPYLDS